MRDPETPDPETPDPKTPNPGNSIPENPYPKMEDIAASFNATAFVEGLVRLVEHEAGHVTKAETPTEGLENMTTVELRRMPLVFLEKIRIVFDFFPGAGHHEWFQTQVIMPASKLFADLNANPEKHDEADMRAAVTEKLGQCYANIHIFLAAVYFEPMAENPIVMDRDGTPWAYAKLLNTFSPKFEEFMKGLCVDAKKPGYLRDGINAAACAYIAGEIGSGHLSCEYGWDIVNKAVEMMRVKMAQLGFRAQNEISLMAVLNNTPAGCNAETDVGLIVHEQRKLSAQIALTELRREIREGLHPGSVNRMAAAQRVLYRSPPPLDRKSVN